MIENQYPAINPNARQFMIGYGTLMQQQSRQRTHPEIVDVYPVMVEGVQRVWGLADTTYGMTYLTAIDDPTASFNAVYYQCTPEDIRQCDQREYSYYREKIDQSRLHALGLSTLMEGDYWMYVMPASTITLPTADTPLVQSYIDVVLDGCFQIESQFHLDDFASQFYATTRGWPDGQEKQAHWINDRIHPRRPAATPSGLKIDRLLSSHVTGYYDHPTH